jgi:hypothetical protein
MVLHLCHWNTKKYCKALVGAPIQFLISKLTKNEEDMGLELERSPSNVGWFSDSHPVLDPVLRPVLTMRTGWHPYMLLSSQTCMRTSFFLFCFFLKKFLGEANSSLIEPISSS